MRFVQTVHFARCCKGAMDDRGRIKGRGRTAGIQAAKETTLGLFLLYAIPEQGTQKKERLMEMR